MKLTTIGAHAKRISLRRIMSGQKGQTLLEILVSLAILGVVGAAFLGSITVGYAATALNREKTTAESLARTQLETVRNTDYPISGITTTPADHPSYTVTVQAQYIDPTTYENVTLNRGMQLVTVTVRHGTKVVLVSEENKKQ